VLKTYFDTIYDAVMPAYTFKGNDTATPANAKNLTITETQTILGIYNIQKLVTIGTTGTYPTFKEFAENTNSDYLGVLISDVTFTEDVNINNSITIFNTLNKTVNIGNHKLIVNNNNLKINFDNFNITFANPVQEYAFIVNKLNCQIVFSGITKITSLSTVTNKGFFSSASGFIDTVSFLQFDNVIYNSVNQLSNFFYSDYTGNLPIYFKIKKLTINGGGSNTSVFFNTWQQSLSAPNYIIEDLYIKGTVTSDYRLFFGIYVKNFYCDLVGIVGGQHATISYPVYTNIQNAECPNITFHTKGQRITLRGTYFTIKKELGYPSISNVDNLNFQGTITNNLTLGNTNIINAIILGTTTISGINNQLDCDFTGNITIQFSGDSTKLRGICRGNLTLDAGVTNCDIHIGISATTVITDNSGSTTNRIITYLIS